MPSKNQLTAILWLGLFLILSPNLDVVEAQENAQLAIPPSLIECYNTSFFVNRDNRLPFTMETLITLIEKAENSPNNNYDIRQMAVALLHRFRQDGIERAANVNLYPGVIPYAPTGFQFPKFRILLQQLIPGNALNFPNNSLSREERCSLHFMLSSSFDMQQRPNEAQVCNSLSSFRSQRLTRSINQRNNFLGDVELLENYNDKQRQAPKLRSYNGKTMDWEFAWSDFAGTQTTGTVSQCPVENGVVRTQWGTVAAGTVIAGIAAGLQQQTVQLRTLLAFSRRPGNIQNAAQVATFNIDNRMAATLAGDLSEITLLQVPASSTNNATVGATGAWNNTVMPKWYFLSQRQNLEMTDAEIRGGIDGLILSLNVASWRSQAQSIKLSQLLRSYYSMNGVLNSGIMACQRQSNFASVTTLNALASQTAGFAQVLDRNMQLRVTLSPSAITQFAQTAAQALTSYVPNYLNDVSCPVSSATSLSNMTTAMTDIYIYLDTSWQYNIISNYVNYVLQRLNINPYASSVTLLSAGNATVMVGYTNYLTDVYRQWNVTTHSWYSTGFSLPSILQSIQNLTQSYMNGQQANNTVGGRSMVALLIPNQSGVSAGDSNYALPQLKYLSEQVPDLYFIYYGGGSIQRFSNYVRNASSDLFTINTGNTVFISAEPVVTRIKSIPRRIINPSCGSSWWTNTWGTNKMIQYIYPGQINFYRMVPNYFFGSGTGRYVSVTSQNYMQYTVCASRWNANPLLNTTTGSTSSTQNCVPITSSPYTYDLSNACSGYNTIHECPPLYISVMASVSQPQNTPCTNNACQAASQIGFAVSVNNLGCYSSVAQLAVSCTLIFVSFLLCQLLK